MKKKLGNILIFVLIIGLTIGYGIYKDSQSRVTVNKIYTMEFQEQALSDLENEKGNGNYTLQNIFMKYNPFSTNTQSMYVYFNTSKVAKITKKLMILPDETIVYPGHGKSTMIREEKPIYLELKPRLL